MQTHAAAPELNGYMKLRNSVSQSLQGEFPAVHGYLGKKITSFKESLLPRIMHFHPPSETAFLKSYFWIFPSITGFTAYLNGGAFLFDAITSASTEALGRADRFVKDRTFIEDVSLTLLTVHSLRLVCNAWSFYQSPSVYTVASAGLDFLIATRNGLLLIDKKP